MLDKLPKDERWIVTNKGYENGLYTGRCICVIFSSFSSGGAPKWTGYGDTPEEAIEDALQKYGEE
jgi:hypothetical protein